jgi:hypothetical protein
VETVVIEKMRTKEAQHWVDLLAKKYGLPTIKVIVKKNLQARGAALDGLFSADDYIIYLSPDAMNIMLTIGHEFYHYMTHIISRGETLDETLAESFGEAFADENT